MRLVGERGFEPPTPWPETGDHVTDYDKQIGFALDEGSQESVTRGFRGGGTDVRPINRQLGLRWVPGRFIVAFTDSCPRALLACFARDHVSLPAGLHGPPIRGARQRSVQTVRQSEDWKTKNSTLTVGGLRH